MGNGPPRVKAYVGPLPTGANGYAFRTDIAPSGTRYYFGQEGVEWREGSPGVEQVPGEPETVSTKVEIIDD